MTWEQVTKFISNCMCLSRYSAVQKMMEADLWGKSLARKVLYVTDFPSSTSTSWHSSETARAVEYAADWLGWTEVIRQDEHLPS